MLTVTILTKNNEATICKTLDALKSFPEVLLLDNGSTDQTLEIAKTFKNVVIHQAPFSGFGPMHNLAATKATYDWILSLDADEVLTSPLDIELNPSCVYSFPFHNFFNEKWIKWCGWYPDRHVRLYNRTKTQFSDALVHEKILTEDLKIVHLDIPIQHYSYQTIDDFLTKMQRYSSLFCDQNTSLKSSLFKAMTHGWWAFIKSYIIKRGFLGGREGFIISQYNAHTAYYKYLKLAFA